MVDFDRGGAYSIYNYELFFHIPMLIGDRLSKNQRCEEAQRWYHFVFDPLARSDAKGAKAFWKFKPFHENADDLHPIQELMALLAGAETDLDAAEVKKLKDDLRLQIALWQNDPFKPHLIARLRPLAYQWNVVMKYLDNLIAWGDQLFRRDTIESINEATQLYVLAADILGARPHDVPRELASPMTYAELLESGLDDFSNALVLFEPLVVDLSEYDGGNGGGGPVPDLKTLYFCIPRNEKVLSYWDTVADRLFKIRHCMNIEGVVRQLPLFEPPIDPALLVRAAAAGIDIGSVLNQLSAAVPHHRYGVLHQNGERRWLGRTTALEKRDAEAVARLRSGHELQLLDDVRAIKTQQIEETQHVKSALLKSREIVDKRQKYYGKLTSGTPPFLNQWEVAHLLLTAEAAIAHAVIEGVQASAAASYPIPTGMVGGAGISSPVQLNTIFSGEATGDGIEAGAKTAGIVVTLMREAATVAAVMGTHYRRADEWTLQESCTAKELEQIDKQIAAADIRIAIAQQELANHDQQVERAKEADAFMRDKFTNQELYDWMVSQTAAVYFQSYQLAFDMARKAERAFQFERASDNSFIQFGYWDSLTKGLLAGEKLQYDLRRLEAAYLEQGKLEYEIVKHVSLALTDAPALVELRETGECFVEISEALFDLDFPGHTHRRVHSVGLTIPCVTGPLTGVNCTLTLLENSVRVSSVPTGADGNYARDANGDSRFRDSVAAIQSIVTSGGQNDFGRFDSNSPDERYRPFENAGAISKWRIELPKDCNHFDFATISDVLLHLRYTARDGGGILRDAAMQEIVKAVPKEGVRLFSARYEFPTEWHRFLHPVVGQPVQTLQFTLTPARFPFQYRDMPISVSKIELVLRLRPILVSTYMQGGAPLKVSPSAPDNIDPTPGTLTSSSADLDGTPHAILSLGAAWQGAR